MNQSAGPKGLELGLDYYRATDFVNKATWCLITIRRILYANTGYNFMLLLFLFLKKENKRHSQGAVLINN